MSLRKKTRTLNALWSNLFLLHKESYAQALSKHYTCNMLQTFAKRLMLVADFIPSSSFLKRRSEFVENLGIFVSKSVASSIWFSLLPWFSTITAAWTRLWLTVRTRPAQWIASMSPARRIILCHVFNNSNREEVAIQHSLHHYIKGIYIYISSRQ